jgi:threonine dehydrogenase-like Zn-dependent dehydrogenase
VAHPSQLYRVPHDLPDEAAVAIEPLACAVHAALKANPRADETALVIGAGSVGLFAVAALRRLTRAGRIICVAKDERQRKEALRLGADEVVHPEETYTTLPDMLGTQAYHPELGKPVVMGGAEKVFECVGSTATMEDAVRLTRPGGAATLVGMPSARNCLDLTALWHKEVSLAGAYAYGVEDYEGERVKSFDLALRIAPQIKLETLVGPRFRLREYRDAVAAARAAGHNGHVKVVFDHR